ncbi:MAG: hypothetical protein EXS42_02900 [Lacunisphaera sp.]|nr:hypothetical protein [Lacunisphaera sp.]
MKLFLFLLVVSLTVRAVALSPSDLSTTVERDMYKQLAATDQAAADSYLATRDYVRVAKEIVASDGNNAANMPGRPKNSSSRYLSADGKDKDIINEAVRLSVNAVPGGNRLPSARENAAAISPKSLPTEAERAKYQVMAATEQSEAESYLVTRNYLRKARAVVDGQGKGALNFSTQPRGYGLRHLSADGKEVAVISEALKLSIAAMSESR